MKTVSFATIEEALEQLRQGKPVLVTDDPDRENEVDAIIAAQSVTEKWMGWIIRHSSGYLCAPMTDERADALNLPLMVPNSQDPKRTAYTVTVDAATGVTTGISAHDRARTIRVLADPTAGAEDLVRPGHVLPLRAVRGGVLHRGGHTEAAVDLTRLAGLAQVAGIAELVNDDGSMIRTEGAAQLAENESLALITIADLKAWRRAHGERAEDGGDIPVKTERVVRGSRASLPTEYGQFDITSYRDLRSGATHVALVAPGRESLVRVHSECLTGDALGSQRCDCGPQLQESMRRVAERGGAVIYLHDHEGRGIGLAAKIDAYALQDRGRDTVQANLELGWPADRREYGAAAAILADLGLDDITLLTNNPAKVEGLRAHGIAIRDTESIVVGLTPHNRDYLHTKAERMGHTL